MKEQVYDFDGLVQRKGTDSVKWDGMHPIWGRDDLLPMWVADMDFKTPPFILEALKHQLEQGVLGYTMPSPEWAPTLCDWLARRHQWSVKPQQLTFVSGIVRGLAYALLCLTQPKDRVLVMSPVYHPFFLVTQRLDRQVVYSPLQIVNQRFELDFCRFRQDIKGCKVMILCNPHNPGGRVWSREELQTIATICHQEGVLVISDEIHADLTLPGYRHIPYANVSAEAAAHSITFMAPSKTFNIPGVASSFAVTLDDTLRQRFQSFMEAGEFGSGHMFAYTAAVAAYRHGEAWLTQLLAYLDENIRFTEQFLKDHVPGISMMRPQASFLIYLDCRELHLSQKDLVQHFVEAGLALNDGSMFGPEGEGFMRLNVACPRSVLAEALGRLASCGGGRRFERNGSID